MKLGSTDHLTLGTITGTSLITAMLYPKLPDRIPTHFDAHGVANGWMTRQLGSLLLPAISLAVWVLLRFGGLLLPREWRQRLDASPMATVGAIVAALLCALQGVVLYAATVRPPTVAVALGLIVGVFFVLLGLVAPRIRRNPWVGVRTPWTLSSDENWARTHRFSGYAFVLAGALVSVAVVTGGASAVPGLIGAAVVAPIVYSFLLARRLPPSP